MHSEDVEEEQERRKQLGPRRRVGLPCQIRDRERQASKHPFRRENVEVPDAMLWAQFLHLYEIYSTLGSKYMVHVGSLGTRL